MKGFWNFSQRMEACVVSKSNMVLVVWPIFGCSTDLCDRFSGSMRSVRRCLLDGIFFFFFLLMK